MSQPINEAWRGVFRAGKHGQDGLAVAAALIIVLAAIYQLRLRQVAGEGSRGNRDSASAAGECEPVPALVRSPAANIRAEPFGCIDLNPIRSFTDHYHFD